VGSRGNLTTAIAALVGVLALASLTGCEGTVAMDEMPAQPPIAAAAGAPTSAPTPTPSAPPVVTVAPQDGETVALGSEVAVSVANGTLTAVSVSGTNGVDVLGALDPEAHSWTSTGALSPATHYLVTATAVDSRGSTTERSSSFTTEAPPKVLGVKIAPLEGETVGVGMPIILYFSAPVLNKAAVEKALTVDMSQPVPGGWHWYGSSEVHYRPMQYWPAGEQVTLHANLQGVDAGNGVWGLENRTLNFTVGDSHVSTVDATTHLMTVVINGVVARKMDVSTGRDKYPTTSGIHLVLEKVPTVIMDSATVGIPKGSPDYYYETVDWDVRISWSGEYVHAAPWSLSAQGRQNVSHGCVNASPADAKWLYGLSLRGDIVTVTGTPRPLQSGNGWTDWNVSWADWVAGSAIDGTGTTGNGSAA
jgi:lipoprotein-anchoring transpeptidase ErfK/SrfK